MAFFPLLALKSSDYSDRPRISDGQLWHDVARIIARQTHMPEFEEYVIYGETSAGRRFRPSDWAERLCSLFATMGPDNRTCYSPHVVPVNREGLACVVVNKAMQTADPRAFKFLMDFARDNDLRVVEGRRAPRKHSATTTGSAAKEI